MAALVLQRKEELAVDHAAAGQGLGSAQAEAGVRGQLRGVVVDKFCGVHGLAVQAVDRFGSGQLAVLGVYVKGHGVAAVVVGDVAQVAVDHLADSVGVFADMIQLQRAKGHVALGIVGGGLDELAVLIQQGEGELVRGQGVIAHIGDQRLVCGQGHYGRGGLLNVLVLGLGGLCRGTVADLDLGLVLNALAHSIHRYANREAYGTLCAGFYAGKVPGHLVVRLVPRAAVVGAHEFGASGHSVGHDYGGSILLQVLVLDGVGQLVAHFQGGVGILVSGLAGQVVVGGFYGSFVVYESLVGDVAVIADGIIDLDFEAYGAACAGLLALDIPGQQAVIIRCNIVSGGIGHKGGVGGNGVFDDNIYRFSAFSGQRGYPVDLVGQHLAGAYKGIVDVFTVVVQHFLVTVGVIGGGVGYTVGFAFVVTDLNFGLVGDGVQRCGGTGLYAYLKADIAGSVSLCLEGPGQGVGRFIISGIVRGGH